MAEDLKNLMGNNFIAYATYVVKDRAIPKIDGLKPVQRRILYTLWKMNDGKFHKVANVAGQTMALHPHGEAPINEALVNMANRGYLLLTQGNFGNPLTGDPSAAPRYIETKLSPLALETLFNPDLTPYAPSYDGRYEEPLMLPAKIPLLLLQGADGIAVGMSTRIFPHNFVELLEAEIAILEEKEFDVLPDFPTGGIMDGSQYEKGKGKIKLRAKIEIRDPKTIAITEVCYGTTSESLIRSIDEAAKKGKIKIESINDYTTDKIEIEIKLPRGQYAEEMIDALYAYTECEVTLYSQIVAIKDNYPWEGNTHEILHNHVHQLMDYLNRELEIERDKLKQKIFERTLEQIFIENRLYKKIEEIPSYELVHKTIASSLVPFHPALSRVPTEQDRENLLSIPIRRITRFDIDKNQQEIASTQEQLEKVEKELKNIKKFTIQYIKNLLKKYGKDYPRRTIIGTIQELDKRAIATRTIKVGIDLANGFIGTKVSGESSFECTNFDKLAILYQDGSYTVTNIPEKQYIHREGNKAVYVGPADKKTEIWAVYKNSKTSLGYAKRFIIEKFILDKIYRYLEEETTLELLTTKPGTVIETHFIPKPKQKNSKATFSLDTVLCKGVSAKGIRISPREIKRVTLAKKQPDELDLFSKMNPGT